LNLKMPRFLQFFRCQAHPRTNGGGAASGWKNHFDSRRVNCYEAAVIKVREFHADLGSGVGCGQENILLKRSLWRNGRRNAAERNIPRLNDCYGCLRSTDRVNRRDGKNSRGCLGGHGGWRGVSGAGKSVIGGNSSAAGRAGHTFRRR
jgi:hypothetical protein